MLTRKYPYVDKKVYLCWQNGSLMLTIRYPYIDKKVSLCWQEGSFMLTGRYPYIDKKVASCWQMDGRHLLTLPARRALVEWRDEGGETTQPLELTLHYTHTPSAQTSCPLCAAGISTLQHAGRVNKPSITLASCLKNANVVIKSCRNEIFIHRRQFTCIRLVELISNILTIL